MTTNKIILTKLEASEGMYLTNGESFGKVVYLGAGDSAENWHEITEAEYKEAMAQDDGTLKNNESK